MNNWIEVSAPNLTSNFRALQRIAHPAEILAVVKANAYGHGAVTCAPILVRAGARWLGVTSASEGAIVRQSLKGAGPATQILVMSGSLPADVPTLIAHSLTPVLWTPEQIYALHGANLPVHVEVDTGMSRQGVLPGPQLDKLLQLIKASNIRLNGLFTHFASTEVANSAFTQLQQQRFETSVAQLRDRALVPRWLHAGNTSTIDNPAQPTPWLADLASSIGARPMIRSGLALYGYTLPIEGAAPAVARLRPALQPVMTWKAAVLSTRTLSSGDTVGYNATFTAPHRMRVALLPVGYADGLRRELSSHPITGPNGWVVLGNQRCPILGRISMNLTVVDITHLPGAIPPGTPATILGPQITADDHAALAHTIPYEILCGIHPST